MILFLNKIDIFKQKILVSPVSKWFPDFEGKQKEKRKKERITRL